MKIYVGSKNTAKVGGVALGARAYWPDAQVEGHEVESGVSVQPLGYEETMQGALNRARAVHALGGADLGVGLEGGVVDIQGTPVMMSYVAVTDGVRSTVVPVTGMPLPKAWGEALQNGAELRPLVQAAGLPYDYIGGVSAILSNNTISRDTTFAEGVKCALLPWVNPAAYASDAETQKAA